MIGQYTAARWLCRFASALAITIVVAAPAHAQTFCDLPNGNNKTCTTPAMTITMQVPNATRLSMMSSLTLPNNDVKASDYVAGFKASGTVSLTAKSNSTANISITQSSNPATYSGFEWSTDGTTFNSPSALFSTGGATAGLTKVITFRTKLQWASDTPGSYTQTLNFTIIAP
jgi:hypothetical protein